MGEAAEAEAEADDLGGGQEADRGGPERARWAKAKR